MRGAFASTCTGSPNSAWVSIRPTSPSRAAVFSDRPQAARLTGFASAGRSIARGADGLAHTVATATST